MGSSSSKAKAKVDSSHTADAAFVNEPTINNLDDAVIELAKCVRDCKDIFKAFMDVFVTVGGVTYFIILPTYFYFSWRSHRKEMDRSAKELEILKKETADARKRSDDYRKELDDARKRLDDDRLERLRKQQKSHSAATPFRPTEILDDAKLHKLLNQHTSHSAAPPPLPPSSSEGGDGGGVF